MSVDGLMCKLPVYAVLFMITASSVLLANEREYETYLCTQLSNVSAAYLVAFKKNQGDASAYFAQIEVSNKNGIAIPSDFQCVIHDRVVSEEETLRTLRTEEGRLAMIKAGQLLSSAVQGIEADCPDLEKGSWPVGATGRDVLIVPLDNASNAGININGFPGRKLFFTSLLISALAVWDYSWSAGFLTLVLTNGTYWITQAGYVARMSSYLDRWALSLAANTPRLAGVLSYFGYKMEKKQS